MASETITIARADLGAEVSRALIGSLNDELRVMYPEPGATHFQLDPEEVSGGRGSFLVVYQDGAPVGCGAFRLLDAETAELKRMYVAPTVRGTGLGRRLVTALEAEARALGVRRLVLETGVGRRPPSRSIEPPVSSPSLSTGSTLSRRKPACVWEKSSFRRDCCLRSDTADSSVRNRDSTIFPIRPLAAPIELRT